MEPSEKEEEEEYAKRKIWLKCMRVQMAYCKRHITASKCYTKHVLKFIVCNRNNNKNYKNGKHLISLLCMNMCPFWPKWMPQWMDAARVSCIKFKFFIHFIHSPLRAHRNDCSMFTHMSQLWQPNDFSSPINAVQIRYCAIENSLACHQILFLFLFSLLYERTTARTT